MSRAALLDELDIDSACRAITIFARGFIRHPTRDGLLETPSGRWMDSIPTLTSQIHRRSSLIPPDSNALSAEAVSYCFAGGSMTLIGGFSRELHAGPLLIKL